MDKIRSFIAVPIPAEVRRQIAEIEKQLMASGADVKWVPEGNFHITLKFLSYVEPERLDAVSKAVSSALEGMKSFEGALYGVGAFPRLSRPSVIWVGMTQGADELKALAERAETALGRIGFGREERPFSAHITVGRVRSPKNLDGLRKKIEQLREAEVGSFSIERVTVMRSDLYPTGPVYSEIANYKLSRLRTVPLPDGIPP